MIRYLTGILPLLSAERQPRPRNVLSCQHHRYAGQFSPPEYVRRVERGELHDPTLSFQLGHGFRLLGVVSGYLRHDPESLGYAAVIEGLNPELAATAAPRASIAARDSSAA